MGFCIINCAIFNIRSYEYTIEVVSLIPNLDRSDVSFQSEELSKPTRMN